MFRRVFSSIEVDGCPACGGIWLDHGELQGLAKDPATLRAVERTFAHGTQPNKPERTNQCPRCQAPLTAAEFDAFQGIRLDRCKPCGGLFLDPGKAGQISERLEKAAQPAPSVAAAGLPHALSTSLAVRFGAEAPAARPTDEPLIPPDLKDDFWEMVRATDFVVIQQQFEIAELFGIESRNKYSIRTESGEVGWAAEQSKDGLGFLLRQFLGHWRPFEIHVFNRLRQSVLRAVHPFRFLFQRLEIFHADGRPLGALQQRFSFLNKRFDVEDAAGRVVMTVSSPLWRIWTFPFLRAGKEVGVIEKKWSGFLTEAYTDKDRFIVRFGPELTDQERALLVVAGIFVDLLYFERKAR